MRIFIRKWLVPIVALMSSCTKAVIPEEGPAPVAFWVEAGDLPVSRAPGEVDDLSLDGYSFGVLAYNTGRYSYADSNVNPNFMYNEDVTYSAETGLGHCLYSTLPEETEGAWSTDEGVGVFYIPLDMEGDPQTVTLMVDYTVRRISGDGTADIAEHRESSFPQNRYPEAFAPGKKLSSIGISLL